MTIEAVEAVGAGAASMAQCSICSSRSVEKSLVELTRRRALRMLETVREYAQEKLDDPPMRCGGADAPLEFFVGLAERARPELWGPAQGQWLRRLDPDRDNFLAALAWCDRADDGTRGLRLVNALQLTGCLAD